MLSKRNLLARTYDERLALEAFDLISENYYMKIQRLMDWFAKQVDEGSGN